MSNFNNKRIDIVIARYNENLEWLLEINDENFNIIVYNKGVNDNFIKLSNMSIFNLDNVGREGHTYLYHIINDYNNLADITIFLPGSGNIDYKSRITKNLLRYIKEYNNAVFLHIQRFNNVKDELYNFTIDEYVSTDIQNKSLNPESKLDLSEIRPFGKWYEYYFNDIVIHHTLFWGIFSVDKRDISQHSKEYYEYLIQQLSNSSNPEVGHYFERAWCAVFYPMKHSLISRDCK
jgi:hypothetical protein